MFLSTSENENAEAPWPKWPFGKWVRPGVYKLANPNIVKDRNNAGPLDCWLRLFNEIEKNVLLNDTECKKEEHHVSIPGEEL